MENTPSITITPIPALSDNYIWAITTENTRACAVVDPGDAAPVFAYLRYHNLNLSAIFITHHHWDHTNGIEALLEKFPDTPVYGPIDEPVSGMDHLVEDGDTIEHEALGLSLRVMAIPGHTLGHVAYIGDGFVFTGDTLFTCGCGKIFEGTADQMHESLQKISALPDDTLIYCGHEYTLQNLQFAKLVEPENADILTREKTVKQWRDDEKATVPSTLAIERLTNPFLRTHEQAVVRSAEQFCHTKCDSPVLVLSAIRNWKNTI